MPNAVAHDENIVSVRERFGIVNVVWRIRSLHLEYYTLVRHYITLK